MVRLEEINYKNVWKIAKLKVKDSQGDFVASNTQSLIEAYLTLKDNNGKVFTFGIFSDDNPIGFLMIGYDVIDPDEDNIPKVSYKNYLIWRFMIDEKYQNQGFGKEALKLAIDFIKTFPCGISKYCYLSYEPDNLVAKKLYNEFGFIENGEYDGDEVVAVLKL